jgi:hypothetical protein
MPKKYWTRHALRFNLVQPSRYAPAVIRQRRMPVSFESLPPRKKPQRAHVNTDEKLLVGRGEAAQMLSISERALDYLVAHKQLTTRRIGSRVLIPTADLRRFTRSDHPERLAS